MSLNIYVYIYICVCGCVCVRVCVCVYMYAISLSIWNIFRVTGHCEGNPPVVDFPHKDQCAGLWSFLWCGALMISLIWANSGVVGDLRRRDIHVTSAWCITNNGCGWVGNEKSHDKIRIIGNPQFTLQVSHVCLVRVSSSGGRFKNTYELLNQRALKFSYVNKIHIFQCMGKIFCVEFQRYPLKFHTKYLTHTLKDMIFMQFWNF